MGRPLKTNKWNGTLNIDYGYPNDGTTDNGYDTDNPGVVGGDPENRWQIVRAAAAIKMIGAGTITTDATSNAVTGLNTAFDSVPFSSAKLYTTDGTFIGVVDSASGPDELVLTANAAVTLTDVSFNYADPDTGVMILKQKGKRKFLVAQRDSIQDEYIVAGNSYFIESAGDTDWAALGAGPDAGYGKIFTATANGTGLTTTGSVYPVGVCTLVDETSSTDLEAGEMYITYYDPVQDDTFATSELTNHWLRPWGPQDSATKYIAQLTDSSTTPDDATGYTSVDVNDFD